MIGIAIESPQEKKYKFNLRYVTGPFMREVAVYTDRDIIVDFTEQLFGLWNLNCD